ERENAAAGERGRGPGAGARHRLPETSRIVVDPDFLARGRLVANHRFLFAALFLREQPVADDDHGGPRRADGLAPKQTRRVRIPVARDGHPADHAVAVGAAVAGPVSGGKGRVPPVGRGARRTSLLAGSLRQPGQEPVLRRWVPAPTEI